MNRNRSILATLSAMLLLGGNTGLHADDWPQWMGPHRDGVWRETGIVESLPQGGPKVVWKAKVNAGYSGPAVANGRLVMMDRKAGTMAERKRGEKSLPEVPGDERVLCLDASTGTTLWEFRHERPYRISYPAGPRTTPVIADGRVFTLGAMGDLHCLALADGKVSWSRNFMADFALEEPPAWGWSAHPLLDGERLICLVGGSNSAVVAFHKDTGRELWRALSAKEIGYAPPVIATSGGRRHLIVWHPDAVAGLEPETGKVLWEQPYPVGGKPQRPEVTIATPRIIGDRLFLTSFYQGSMLLRIPTPGSAPQIVWNRRSTSRSEMNDGLHTTMCTPVVSGDHVYGVCGFGELRCLSLDKGDRLWESYAVTGGRQGLFANAFIVVQGDRNIFWSDHGELVFGRLGPKGFAETSRAKLLDAIENTLGRDVLWCHPAFANRRAYMHNGRDLICVELSADAYKG